MMKETGNDKISSELQEFQTNALLHFQSLFDSVTKFHTCLARQEHAFHFRDLEEWKALIPVSFVFAVCS